MRGSSRRKSSLGSLKSMVVELTCIVKPNRKVSLSSDVVFQNFGKMWMLNVLSNHIGSSQIGSI